MSARQDSLSAAADLLAARIAELDAMSADVRARTSFTDDHGRSFSWNEYRASLVAAIKELTAAPAGGSSLIQQAGDPFTVLA